MPTFDEDVIVNGQIGISNVGEGAILLNLDTERRWELRQLGTGQDTQLELASVGGGGNKNFIINTTGRVGIGTSTPRQTLDVAGSIGAAGQIGISNTGNGAILLNLGTERHWELRQLGTGQDTQLELASVGGGGNKNFIINTTGRVGIGTTTPKATLDVAGSIQVSDDVVLAGADCAEEFSIDDDGDGSIEAGTVMVISSEGRLKCSTTAYDRRVAGILSGAGDLKPGVILGRQPAVPPRPAIALNGTAYCRVDATDRPVRVGDLLTSSDRKGHSMRADDPTRSFGAVLGKALQDLPSGIGLIRILVALQ